PRKIIRMSILGMREEVLSSDILWMCSRCYTCAALCPQNVKFTDVISILRDMAVKEGYVQPERLEKALELDKVIQSLRCKIIKNKLHPDENGKAGILKTLEDELDTKW
ncbi:MAG: hypothetical protein KAW14_10250, partial [Candidatus Aegiribacteria sp.]|nr:hypothetical protein [Candidatus Aegiribacteria sp.]